MRRKDKFIFFFYGFITPFIFLIFWFLLLVLSTLLSFEIGFIGELFRIFVFLGFPVIVSRYIKNISIKQIKRYKKEGGQLSEKVLTNLASTWFTLVVFLFIVLILALIILPGLDKFL